MQTTATTKIKRLKIKVVRNVLIHMGGRKQWSMVTLGEVLEYSVSKWTEDVYKDKIQENVPQNERRTESKN